MVIYAQLDKHHTLCPVLSEGTVVTVAMSKTELDSPSVTCAGAASISVNPASSP